VRILFDRSLEDNHLDGVVPSTIWNDIIFTGNRSLVLYNPFIRMYRFSATSNYMCNNLFYSCRNFQNNHLETIPIAFDPPANVTIMYVLMHICNLFIPVHIHNPCSLAYIIENKCNMNSSTGHLMLSLSNLLGY
jgi:hypothetical protein